MKQLVLNTPLVQIFKTSSTYEMIITCKDGTKVMHEPFKGDLEGLVTALSLSAEICAGKFFLRSVVKDSVSAKLLLNRNEDE